MLERSPSASYVWIFAPDGIYSVKAEDVLSNRLIVPVETVGQQIAEGLRCTEGDPAIGRNTALPLPESLTEKMRELAAPKAIEFLLNIPKLLKPVPRRPRRRRGK